ncbi:MAG: ATP-binding cassette domain-containing protein [Ruminococcaceae bacterium]|nr:ATP-binding cassette domain-containing protein [Oscillospiraceae bacterium]
MLHINNVSKSYGTNKALSGFTAELDTGIYALLGPNGSGKSTLINIITDNLKADSGEITFSSNGSEPENVLKMGLRFREKLGFMPQYPGMYPNMTVERFMWYMAALKGMDKKEAMKQIPEILAAVELDDIPRYKIGGLSGGMKQRLCLAQAVLGDPSVLILDEPTAGLDPKQRIAIRNYISRIAFNKTVLIATHVVSDIEYIAKEIIILKKGVIQDNAPVPELLKKIEGKVWNVPCTETEVTEYQRRFRVTNIAKTERNDGKIVLRVLSEERPTEDSVHVSPALEDYYLYIFGESHAL